MSDNSFKMMIGLASAGARGDSFSSKDIDWQKMLQLAVEHNVIPLVACGVKNSIEMDCPEVIEEYLLGMARNSASTNLIRRQRIMHLLGELGEAGIEVQLLKGYAVAQYYAHPESRDSVDTDLWVEEKQEKVIYEFLRKKDFDVIPRSYTSHHGICQHKKYGKIEVHTKLYDEIVEDVWFLGMDEAAYVLEEPILYEHNDGSFLTLGHTDQAIFLALHMVKHFIESGLSIRMMLDLSLFLMHNHGRVDYKRFSDAMEHLNYAQLIGCVFSVMVKYGGFSEKVFGDYLKADDDLTDLLLQDMFRGGYMGSKEMDERYISSMAYNRTMLMKNKSKIQYIVYMLCWKVKSGAKRIFPDYSRMIKLYPSVKRIPVVLPFAWMIHSIKYIKQKIDSGILKKEIQPDDDVKNTIAASRIRLFKSLNMI